MTTHVESHLDLRVDHATDAVFSLAVARGWARSEELTLTVDGRPLAAEEIADEHGTRLHRATLPEGEVVVRYRAEVERPTEPVASDVVDPLRYLRPSRFIPSDELAATALSWFGGATPAESVRNIPDWVAAHLSYVPGSSGPTDTAIHTLLLRQGVCRDYAHLTAGLLRAVGVPARLVSVYAPGLSPMDFHAVVEAFVDGRWEVVDATRLAPRPEYVRIATGRDAADTAFLTTLSGAATLENVEVLAVAGGDLSPDDPGESVLLP
ncbi:transglutaminase-like domain-containing protein [Microbacterium sp. S1037]|uniref:transglutaminase-like domain-containing protein n=1 Tax=Microbacterium sp. S1037 TaxID=3398227 RepID=UPI003AAB0C62